MAEPLPVWQWAEKRRRMPKGVTAKPGPYRVAATPMMREPQEAFFDPAVQTTVLCMASRTGKTETEMNLTGYTIDHDPTNLLWVWPTLDGAKKWRRGFLDPMFSASHCFAGKVRAKRGRDADNSLLSLGFPGGRLTAVGANSPSALRQIQAPRVICEEIDAMDDGPEGDPVTLAFKRADNYPDSVQVVSSTPTITGRSKIWAWLEQSDFRKWFCPCRRCGASNVWAWRHVKMDESDPRTARLVCEKCGEEHDDAQRVASVRAGEWRPTLPFRGIRGFWLNGFNSLFAPKKGFASRLHQIAAEFLDAKKQGREALQTVTNTVFCETFEIEPQTEVDADELTKRGEDYAPDHLPVAVLVLTAGVDVQIDRVEVEVGGYGVDEEFWGVEKKVLEGDPEKDEVWNALDAYLSTVFTREDGVELRIERAFVDMGFKQKRVLAFCGPRLSRGVYPCRGINRTGTNPPPLLPAQPSRNNRARIPHWNVGVTVAKNAIFDRLALPTPGPRSLHWPAGFGYTPDHFRQLTAEVRKTRFAYGQAYFIYEKKSESARNEALDLAVYRTAALESLGRIAWQKRAEYLATLAPKPAPADPADPAAPPVDTPAAEAGARKVPIPRKRSWATSW